MGVRGQEQGDDRELFLDIARQTNKLYLTLKQADSEQLISQFILSAPKHRAIARRDG